ncbi:recombination regulator RecX [Vibrio marisflavi]|uniref:Regulatory protein RecX n=1 Tax=Vibrio marisflavi CECT 7928 TaxID=634439 RepID=A0ABN8E1D8_9VIBR|nr:recombination regulator RecX [Vibrio marisflavi]CAH0538591.1 Regulatory protein RecX [Vibrio marisflavi CECT 7928]
MSFVQRTPSISSIESAMQLLSRRDHGRYELSQKLLLKGYDECSIEQAIEFCGEHNYLDDLRYARSQIRQAVYKGHGERRIKQELMHKRVDESTIEQALEEEPQDWFELAKKTAAKKFKGQKARDAKEYAKQVRFLQYKGFSFDQISYALEEQAD